MYLPRQFESNDAAHALALMRACPLASLISTDDEGFPFVTPLPLHARQERDGGFALLGHCARANPHGGYLRARPHALVTFQGPGAYLSPSVYPDLARVPSWNYLTVQCRVLAILVEDEQEKDALLKVQIADHEPAYAQQWREQSEKFTRGMLAGITAFRLQVLGWQCKLKLNQHRPESHAALHTHYRAGTPEEQALADWMERLGITGQPAQ